MRAVRVAGDSVTGTAETLALAPDGSLSAEAPVLRPVVRSAPAATAVAMARVVRL
jgi:hypothetical protein